MVDRSKLRLGATAVVAFLVVFGAARVMQRARAGPASGGAPVSVSAPAESPPSGSPVGGGSLLYVDVAGEVARPGLYRVPRGSRIAVAIARAGGFTGRAESTQVNLAATLQDGQQVVVPARGAAGTAAAAPGGGSAKRAISLSTATAEDLDSLDGIGPTLAQRIVEYRQAHGGFRSVDELRQVDGIGDKRFQQLKKGLQP